MKMNVLRLAVFVILGVCSVLADKCCMPEQFECKQAITGGTLVNKKPAIIAEYNLISLDGVNKKMSIITNMTIGQMSGQYWVIRLYNEGLLYVVDLKAKTCEKSKLSDTLDPPCSPDNAKEGQKIIYGGGGNTLEARTYSWKDGQEGSIMDNILIMSKDGDDCYAIAMELVGSNNNDPIVKTAGFVDITKGIKSQSIFTPPSYCDQVPMTSSRVLKQSGFLGLQMYPEGL